MVAWAQPSITCPGAANSNTQRSMGPEEDKMALGRDYGHGNEQNAKAAMDRHVGGASAPGMGMTLSKLANDIVPPTTRQQLEQKRAFIMAQLELVDNALEALNNNPGLEQFHESIKRGLNL